MFPLQLREIHVVILLAQCLEILKRVLVYRFVSFVSLEVVVYVFIQLLDFLLCCFDLSCSAFYYNKLLGILEYWRHGLGLFRIVLEFRLSFYDYLELRRALIKSVNLPNPVIIMGLVSLIPSGVLHAWVFVLTEHVEAIIILDISLVTEDIFQLAELTWLAAFLVILLYLTVLISIVKHAFKFIKISSHVVVVLGVYFVCPPARLIQEFRFLVLFGFALQLFLCLCVYRYWILNFLL